jgi:hypothetical protein
MGQDMKNVMVLSVNFPPTSGAGVFRTLKFAKFLPTFGWRPIVVTPQTGTKHLHDDSLTNEIPKDTIVHRPSFFNHQEYLPKILVKMLRPIERRLNYPDKYVRWNKAAFNYISRHIIPKEKIDVIYTSVGPYSTILLSHTLKQNYNIPIFIDFRDPFSFNQYALLDKKSNYIRKARRIEKKVFRDVDYVNNVSEIWKQKYETFYPEINSKSSLIHNGYDEDDFIGLEIKKRNTIFTICYNGTFSRVVPIEPLISAIIEIHQRHNIPICLSIATPTKKEKLLSRYNYLFQNNLIDYKGFLPHRESLKNVYQSDISALILNDSKVTEGMLPAKTFEYLRVGNPILLLHRKESFLAKIIEKTKTGITVNIKNQDEIIRSLLMLYEKWRQNEQIHHPDWDEIKKYERKNLTKQLADIFNKFT